VSVAEKWDVAETVYRYALGIDTRDWPLYRSIFTEEIAIDFSSYNGQPGARMPADAWVQRLQRQFTGLEATQHTMSNPMVDFIDADHARCRMYMQAHHVLDPKDTDSWYTIGGYYDDVLIRERAAWRIAAVTLNVLWQRGDASIMVKARATQALP
jgi:3-phenylpropionate/cinnamic acid dioxygenase small subunit